MNYGCIGEKLSHSFSKEIHNKLFDYEYILKEIPREELRDFMTQKDFQAINVTIPYKEAVIPYLDFIDETAKKIGAVNTIVNQNGKLSGYNTDFLGMKALIEKNNLSLSGKKVLILGSGGTSKTACAVAQTLNAREIYRVSREEKDGCITYETAQSQHADAEVIINTTPCGMYPKINVSAVEIAKFPKLSAVVDAVYNPLRSRLVCDALQAGIPAVGGLYMLVAQAAFAAEYFTGCAVAPEKIDEIYRDLFLSKQNIVLIGMPGSGKSTVGKLLAQALDMDFVDTDAVIVDQTKTPIPEIFATQGENAFRDLESDAVTQVSKQQHTVIATGGGAVLREENVQLLRQNGRIYFLDRPLSAIEATIDRPLSSSREALEQRYAERYDIYVGCADMHLVSNNCIADTVQRIKEDFFDEHSSH